MDNVKCTDDNTDILLVDVDDIRPNNDLEDNKSKCKVYRIKTYVSANMMASLKERYCIISCVVLIIILTIIIIAVTAKPTGRVYVDHDNDSASLKTPISITQNNFAEKINLENYYDENNHNVTANTALSTTSATVSSTNGLILRDKNKLWIYNPQTLEFALFHESKSNITSFDVFGRNTTFWTESYYPSNIYSSNHRLNATHYNSNILFADLRVKPQAMSYDFLTGNLYVVDEEMEALIVMDTHDSQHSLLTTELYKPIEIVSDPYQSYLFILQEQSLLRINMDGSSATTILRRNVASITLDHNLKRIYWIENRFEIMRSDYHGNDIQNVFRDQANIASLAVVDNQLFWLWSSFEHPAMLWSCNIDNQDCNNHKKHHLDNLHDSNLIKTHWQPSKIVNTACSIDNGECQHFCLLTPNDNRNCACSMGWQLNPDSKTCRVVKSFILYSVDYFIRARTLDVQKSISVDTIWPTLYKNSSLMAGYITDFEYDLKSDILYFSVDKCIYKTKLNTSVEPTVLFKINQSSATDIKALAYDWSLQRIYYCTASAIGVFYIHNVTDSSKIFFELSDLQLGGYFGNGYTSTTSRYKYTTSSYQLNNRKRCYVNGYDANIFEGQAILDEIKIDPKTGYLFVKEKYCSYDNDYKVLLKIFSSNENNTHNATTITITPYNYATIPITAIDHIEKRIYWYNENSYDGIIINNAAFNGSDVQNTRFDSRHSGVKSISIYQQWMYVIDSNIISRFHKKTGTGSNSVSLKSAIQNVNIFKIISSVIQTP